jgi:hypothetical protein
MPDDRNGAPPGPPTPFGRAPGADGHPHGGRTNGVCSRGVRQDPADLPTRPLPVDVADGPIDLVAVQADDELVNALGAGAAVTYGDRAPGADPDLRRHRDERLVTMLAAWRAEIEAEPIPELVDLDTAVAAVVSGMKADAAGARRKRADRLRHLAPLAAAAAIIVATVSGVGLGSQDAVPGDVLWPIQKVVNPERAESVETKIEVEGRFQTIRAALSSGDTVTAARELEAIRTEIPEVRDEEGQPLLLKEQEFLAAKLAETPPGTPADLSTPPTSDPKLQSTAAAPPPPPPASTSTDPSQLLVPPDDPSVSKSTESDPRRPPSEAALVPPPVVPESGSEGPTAPGSGSSQPEVTREPTQQAPESTEGGADESTAPAPSGDQPVSEGAGDSSADGPTSTDTTASGSAGTSVDATATATTS